MRSRAERFTGHCGRFGAAPVSRRALLQRSGLGLGWMAASSMLAAESAGAKRGAVGRQDPRPVGSVILLFMAGGPSHVDTFDPKPELMRLDGQQTPQSISERFELSATMGNGTRTLMASPFSFRRYGESGLPVSNLFPWTAQHADRLCVIRSMQHETVIHVPGEYVMTTGSITGDRPSLGAWSVYGLGSENQNLPGFIVLGGGPRPTYASGFLPARYQGTQIPNAGTGLADLKFPRGMSLSKRRQQLDLIRQLNHRLTQRLGPQDSQLDARLRSYELAFGMQMSAPEAFDLSGETRACQRLYGVDQAATAEIGRRCLLARRLVERGVRFIQVRVEGWDSHADLLGGHTTAAAKCDQPIFGLLTDLGRRGLLDSTLVVWGGEFGRTPGVEGKRDKGGRDHSPGGFTVWMAGSGIKGGQVIGATDEVGYTAVENVVRPCDLHATMLHALGVDQRAIGFEHHGRREIPTFNGGRIVREAFA